MKMAKEILGRCYQAMPRPLPPTLHGVDTFARSRRQTVAGCREGRGEWQGGRLGRTCVLQRRNGCLGVSVAVAVVIVVIAPLVLATFSAFIYNMNNFLAWRQQRSSSAAAAQ